MIMKCTLIFQLVVRLTNGPALRRMATNMAQHGTRISPDTTMRMK
jgi:hypothetical protein